MRQVGKRFMAMMLCLVMWISFLPQTAWAITEEEAEDILRLGIKKASNPIIEIRSEASYGSPCWV